MNPSCSTRNIFVSNKKAHVASVGFSPRLSVSVVGSGNTSLPQTVASRQVAFPKNNGPLIQTLPTQGVGRIHETAKSGLRAGGRSSNGTCAPVSLVQPKGCLY